MGSFSIRSSLVEEDIVSFVSVVSVTVRFLRYAYFSNPTTISI